MGADKTVVDVDVNQGSTTSLCLSGYTLTVTGNFIYQGEGSLAYGANAFGGGWGGFTDSVSCTDGETVTNFCNGSLGNNTGDTTGAVVFAGTAQQTISSGGTITQVDFYDLTVNNAAGVVLNTNVVVRGKLTLTNGVLDTNGHTLTVAGYCPGNIVMGSGSIKGTLQMNFPTTNPVTCTFPTADAGGSGGLTVVSVTKKNGSTGTLTVSSIYGNHPDGTTTIGIDQNRNANHYWTISPGSTLKWIVAGSAGSVTTSNPLPNGTPYNASFQYCANTASCTTGATGEMDSGSAPANFYVSEKVGGTWTVQPVANTTNAAGRTSVTGLTNFGVFDVGNLPPPPPDHYRFEFDQQAAMTGVPLPITIKACAKSTAIELACTSLYSASVTLTPGATKGTWAGLSGGTATFTGASAGVTLTDAIAEASTFSYSAPSVTAGGTTALECYNTDASTLPTPHPAVVSCIGAVTYVVVPTVFDAVEVGAVAVGAAKATNLFTKLASVPFSFDVVAVKGNLLDVNYAAVIKIELVDATNYNGTNCGSRPSLQIVNNSFNFAAGHNGRYTLSVTPTNAAPRVNVRITDTTAGLVSCSTDSFAIRPAQLALALTSPAVLVAGDIATGGALTINATSQVGGYSGAPSVDKSKVTDWQNLTIDPAMLQGFFAIGNGTVSVGTFYYGDFGAINFLGGTAPAPGAIYDDTFTAVDKNAGDCVVGSTSNTLGIVSPNIGKYGCVIGTPALGTTGRFRPHHYEVHAVLTPAYTIPPVFPATIADGFTYMGQPALGVTLDITAVNATVVPIPMAMARLLAGASNKPVFSVTADNGGAAIPLDAAHSFALKAFAWPAVSPGGTYSASGPNYNFSRQTIAGPYDSFRLTVTVTDPDGVQITKFNDANIAASSQVSSATTRIRYGKMSLPSATSASELSDLPIKMQIKYCQGACATLTPVWQTNTLDSFTTGVTIALTTPNTPAVYNNTCVLDIGNPGVSGSGCTTAALVAHQFSNQPKAGDYPLWLKAPGAGNGGFVTVNANNVPAWLGGKQSALATFGMPNPGPVIFRHEMY